MIMIVTDILHTLKSLTYHFGKERQTKNQIFKYYILNLSIQLSEYICMNKYNEWKDE